MASIGMLTEAISMVENARQGAAHRKQPFLCGLLRTLGGAGDFHTTLTVPAYPRDAQRQDLQRYGLEIYKAMERHAETQASPRS